MDGVTPADLLVKIVVLLGSFVVMVLILAWYASDSDDR
jgi:hypothetical protein